MAIVDEGQLSFRSWEDVGWNAAGISIGRRSQEDLQCMATGPIWSKERRALARAEIERRRALEE